MYNKVIMIGNLTKDPELRFTPQGTAVTSMRIAVNSRIKVGDEFKDETLFIDVVVFGKQAEAIVQFLNKGSGVLVEGRLRERTWEYEGQKQSKMEILANNIKFLPKRTEQESYPDIQSPPPEETELEPF